MSGSAFSIGSPPLFGVVSLALRLLATTTLLTGATHPYLRSILSASRGDFKVHHARTAIKHHRAFSIVLATVSHLNSALFHGICPVCFRSSLKRLFSPGPGVGAILSNYLEVE